MEPKEIYLKLTKEVTKDIYVWDDQMVAIAHWISNEFELKNKK